MTGKMARFYGDQNYGFPISGRPIPVLEMMFDTVPASSVSNTDPSTREHHYAQTQENGLRQSDHIS